VPTPGRTFTIKAGEVKITVLGTAFSLVRIPERVKVSAESGPLLVEWGAEHRLLDDGQSGWFPPLDAVAPAGAPVSPGSPSPVSAGPAALRTPRGRPPLPGHAAVSDAPPPHALLLSPVAKPTVTSLLQSADAARASGQSREGAALLRSIVEGHAQDPRAPLAAFTLGRVLFHELGQPREAAAAFAQARALSPDGPFAEDALARETEAWASAGDAVTRRARAETYLKLYPTGRRAAAMAVWAAP
jgi:transmembrane sensor